MATATPSAHVSEAEARRVAEEARETEWSAPSFLKELFLGSFRLDLVHPFPEPPPERSEFTAFREKLERFLAQEVDPDAIDREGRIPPRVIAGLAQIGAFGMKIPAEYGGLGFSQHEYGTIIKLISTVDANLIALLSAHQSIGVPQPLKLFGTEEQKKRYLPRLARGAVSAFALTEPEVGSDPANLSTTVQRTPEGDYILDGEKLWTTNGTIAELFVVMARHPDSGEPERPGSPAPAPRRAARISAFIVERDWPGVEVVRRCHFMGLRAIENGVVRFTNVRVPKENLLWAEGRGLKLALVTLNTGRLTLPASAAAVAKRCLEICRRWAGSRVQWGQPIGRHDAIAQLLAGIAGTTFATNAVTDLTAAMADAGGRDLRLEAAVAKMWNSEEVWKIADQTLQIRGGRGYETADSLRARGEEGVPVERIVRDFRINLIFEGSSEIMRLFIAREALDRHLAVAGAFADPKATLGQKLAALPKLAAFYGRWYPARLLAWGWWPRFSDFGPLAAHVRFVERSTRRLARRLFWLMVKNGPKLERRQALLFRAVDVGADLFAMTAALARAEGMRRKGGADGARAVELATVFCNQTASRVRERFAEIGDNDDVARYGVARKLLEGDYLFLEEAIAETAHFPLAAQSEAEVSGPPRELAPVP